MLLMFCSTVETTKEKSTRNSLFLAICFIFWLSVWVGWLWRSWIMNWLKMVEPRAQWHLAGMYIDAAVAAAATIHAIKFSNTMYSLSIFGVESSHNFFFSLFWFVLRAFEWVCFTFFLLFLRNHNEISFFFFVFWKVIRREQQRHKTKSIKRNWKKGRRDTRR